MFIHIEKKEREKEKERERERVKKKKLCESFTTFEINCWLNRQNCTLIHPL